MKLILISILSTVTSTHAAVLVGAGDYLPLPSLPHNSDLGRLFPTISTVSGGFTGTWSSPADSAWHGTFTATGSLPVNSATGSNTWDYTGLNSGQLPAGTLFYLGDLDEGASSTITFKAYDSSGTPLTGWLDEPVATIGTASTIQLNQMPSWEWDSASSTYIFDGAAVSGNPTVGVFMISNQPISSLDTSKNGTSNNFGIYAPTVPEPSSALLLGLGGMAIVLRRRRVS